MIDKGSWEKVRFGDVIVDVKQNLKNNTEESFERIVGLEHMTSGDVHIDKWSINDGASTFTKIFRSGQTLFGKRRAYQKKIAIAEFDGICSGDILVFDSKDETLLLPALIPFVCMSKDFFHFVEANSQGSLSPRVSFSALSRYEFLLPPIDEQKRIAKLLWAADDVLQKNSSIYDALDTIKSVQMDDLAVAITSGNNQCFLSDVIEYEHGQVDPKKVPFRDMPLVAPNHVESGTGKVMQIVSAAEQNAISGKYEFSKGQVVYSKIRPNLNKVFIAEFDGLCSADMYPLRPKKGLRVEYLYYILTSKPFLEYATICSVRTSIPKLNRTDMSNFKLYLSSLQTQDAFVNKMKQIDANIETCRIHIDNNRMALNDLINYYLGGAN